MELRIKQWTRLVANPCLADDDDEDEHADQMRPDVDGFVVDHEQTSHQLRVVEVDPVSPCDVFLVHKFWGVLRSSYVPFLRVLHHLAFFILALLQKSNVLGRSVPVVPTSLFRVTRILL